MKRLGAVLLVAAALLGACATTPQAQFYTLGAAEVRATGGGSALSLAIGPIDLPQYLDRPQIVSRDGDNRLRVDEFNRWGGSLDEEIYRVLAQRLGARLGTQRIYRYPSRIVSGTDYRIALDVREFDGQLEGPVQLDIAWSLIDDRTSDVVAVRRSRYDSGVPAAGYDAYAAALGDLLGRLGDELADVLEGKKKNPPRSDG